jgi:UDP:flavonoid glycosyltransferase YjiC (YdhE family)
VDLYGYAALVEDLGIGAWAGRGSSPTWHADELSEAFLRVLDRDSAASISMRRRAQEIGRIAQANPGREVAAKVIARLAASGE